MKISNDCTTGDDGIMESDCVIGSGMIGSGMIGSGMIVNKHALGAML